MAWCDHHRAGGSMRFRFPLFCPRLGIPEDPVTGSAHRALAPYWASRLSKNSLHARQVSARGGELWCRVQGERVWIGGHATLVAHGRLVAALN
ncbi:PhzF family phenazine biosynthesis protein [Pseudomonas sp. KNUC1026]|nr:PhzF family phenazine biosynthesis protein [Pseudomonas sp. KNUC1026]UFH48396.1 PhzF family phenazine biosynthesis protein [Pseudomonas sp. KNUC1026]